MAASQEIGKKALLAAGGIAIAAYCLLVYDWFHESAGLPPIALSQSGAGMFRLWLLLTLGVCAAVIISLNLFALKRLVQQLTFSKPDITIVAFLLCASFLCRLPFLMHPYSMFSSDDAMMGLMAQDIVAGKPAPTFYYGQSYLGTFLPHFVALLPLARITATSLMVVTWAIFAAFEVLFYWLVLRLMGRTVALVSGLYLAISPFALTESILLPGRAISETLLFCVVMLWFAFLTAQRPAPRLCLISLLGGVAGFSVYVRDFALLAVASLAVFFLHSRRDLIRPRLVALFAAGFALGYLPAILYDLGTGLRHLSSVVDQTFTRDSGLLSGFEMTVSNVWRFTIPIMLGARFPGAERAFSPLLGHALAVLFIVGCLWLVRHFIRCSRRTDACTPDKFILVFIVLFLFAAIALAIMAPERLAHVHRYIDVVYMSISLVFGFGVTRLLERSKSIAIALAVLVLAVNAASNCLYATETRHISDRYRGFVNTLEELRIRHLSSDYWCSTLTTFVTGGQTVCAADAGPSTGERIPELTEEVRRASAPGFALLPCSMTRVLTGYLETRGISYDFRETFFPIWFNLGREVRPEQVPFYPLVAVNLPSPHNDAMCKRVYRQDDDIIFKITVLASEDGTQCDLIAALRDDTGRDFWLPDNQLTPDSPMRLKLDRGRVGLFLIEMKVREAPPLADVTRDTEFEFIAGLAEPGTLEFHDRIDSQWFVVKPPENE